MGFERIFLSELDIAICDSRFDEEEDLYREERHGQHKLKTRSMIDLMREKRFFFCMSSLKSKLLARQSKT